MDIRLADPKELGALSIRNHLDEAGKRSGVSGNDLLIEVIQWGILFDEHHSEGKPPPTLEDYAEQYKRAADQVELDVAEFLGATGVEPRRFWEIEQQGLRRTANSSYGGAVLDEIYVVRED